MRKFVISILTLGLFACAKTSTQAPPVKQPSYQDQESAALAVLANYTGDVLAAAAMPLQYYCQHRVWPAPQKLDITQPIVSNLLGLYYVSVNQELYRADFGLIDHTTGVMSDWEILIPAVQVGTKGVQKVKLEIINNDFKIHLLNVMDFQCQLHQPITA